MFNVKVAVLNLYTILSAASIKKKITTMFLSGSREYNYMVQSDDLTNNGSLKNLGNEEQ